MQEKDVDVLNQRLAAARQSGGSSGPASEAAAADELAAAAAAEQSSFLRSTDEEVASALANRIAKVASAKSMSGGGSSGSQSVVDGSVDGSELTGPQLRDLIFNKWDKTFDLSFVRRDIMGKTLICLNVRVGSEAPVPVAFLQLWARMLGKAAAWQDNSHTMQYSAYLLTYILTSSEGLHNLGLLASLPLSLCPPCR